MWCPNVLGYVAFHWSVINLPKATLLKINWLSFFQKLSITNSFSTTSETSCPYALSVLKFGPPWLCTDLLYAAIYVWLPCCVWKTLFPCSHQLWFCFASLFVCLFVLASSSPVIPKPWEERGLCKCSFHAWAFRSFSSFIPYLVEGVYVNHNALQSEASLMKVERFFGYKLIREYRDRYSLYHERTSHKKDATRSIREISSRH